LRTALCSSCFHVPVTSENSIQFDSQSPTNQNMIAEGLQSASCSSVCCATSSSRGRSWKPKSYTAASAQRPAAARAAPSTAFALDRLRPVHLALRRYPRILDALSIVRPETVVRWHRKGFTGYWRWKSRSPGAGRDSLMLARCRMASRTGSWWRSSQPRVARTGLLRTQSARRRVDHGTICGRSCANSGHCKPLCAYVDRTKFVAPESGNTGPCPQVQDHRRARSGAN
jgi:hypothetical protein